MFSPFVFSEDQENSQFSLSFTHHLLTNLLNKDPFPHFPDNQHSTDEEFSPVYSRPFILNKSNSSSDMTPLFNNYNQLMFSYSLPNLSNYQINTQHPIKQMNQDEEYNEKFTLIIENCNSFTLDLFQEHLIYQIPEPIYPNEVKTNGIILKNPNFPNFVLEILDEIMENLEKSPERTNEDSMTSPEISHLSLISSPNKFSDFSNKKTSCEESLEDFQSQKANFFKKLETITMNQCPEESEEKSSSEKMEDNIDEFAEESVNQPREFIAENKMQNAKSENNEKQEKNEAELTVLKKCSLISEETMEILMKEGYLLKKSRNFLSGWQVICTFMVKNVKISRKDGLF